MMKNFPVLVLLLLAGLTSCKKDAFETEYDKSFKTWQSFKKANNNSYYYIIEFVSWTGYRSDTKITVNNGVIVSREYDSYTLEHTGDILVKTPAVKWTEGPDSIGVHNIGLEPLTLDGIYSKAKNDWLKVSKTENKVYFKTENAGMISVCGYTPNGCMDDCLTGVRISAISPLPVN